MSKAMILVADDDPDILRAVTARLHFAGYEVLPANDGKMATRLALDAAPDLAILDIGMPCSDGHAVARHMLASSDTKNTPIIFLTARTSEEDMSQAFTAGISHYLTKPFKSDELLKTVQYALNCTRRTRRNLEAPLRCPPQETE